MSMAFFKMEDLFNWKKIARISCSYNDTHKEIKNQPINIDKFNKHISSSITAVEEVVRKPSVNVENIHLEPC